MLIERWFIVNLVQHLHKQFHSLGKRHASITIRNNFIVGK